VQRLIENKKIQFDLIHAHFTWPSGYIAVKLKENFHVPVVITIHEDPLWLKNEILMNNLLFNDTWKNADALIRVNSTEVNILKNYNPNSFFVPNGYSSKIQLMDQDMCRKKLNLPIEKKIILNVGNLESIKGQSDLITAICRILKKRNDICCYIIGDGPERKRLQKKIIRLNLQNFIFLKKGVPHYEIPIWMNASNLFVLTSLEESFGIVQIEAMACGKPVIATKTIGSKEILLSEDYGLLTEIGNPENLAKTILIALDRTWNSENIRTYANHYSWDVIKDEILKIYSKINRNNPPI
jgi:glycosyltransferase involved in cell wall biosynthesis